MLTVKQKAAYGLGDFASNMVFQTVANFMLIFYTDVFGLTAGVAGSIIGLVRLSDMITDPLMGALADRTKTRWGRYRPYMLFAPIPFAILLVLAFTTPDFTNKAKIFYAATTYALLMLVYTIVNIPYSALGGAMSEDPRERASLQSYRFAFAMVAAVIIVWVVPKLVDAFGGDNPKLGYSYTMMVLAAFSLCAFLLCFLGTREEPGEQSKQAQGNFFEEVWALLRNDQWAIIFGISFCILVMFSLRISVAPHFVKYYLGQDKDFLATFLLYSNIAAFIAALVTNFASQKYEKRSLLMFAAVGLTVFGAALSFIPPGAALAATIVFVLTQYFQNIVVIIMFSMVADSVDYGQFKSGKRIMAMTFSGHLLAIKFGFGLGGAGAGWLLAYYGFIANQDQSADTLTGMSLIFGVYPAVFSAIAIALAIFYKLSKQRVLEIQRELGQ